MHEKVDDGSGDRKKKEKRGFKVDREARWLEKHRKEKELLSGKKSTSSSRTGGAGKTAAVKEVKFDDASRREFLLSLHKKKNERRVTAVIEARRKQQRETKQFRAQEREEARKQYNEYAKVPILPDYTFKIPNPLEDDGGEEDSDGGDGEEGSNPPRRRRRRAVGDDDDDDEDEDEDEYLPEEEEGGLREEVADVFAGQVGRDRTKELSGMSLHTSDEGYGAVTVDVQPLFGGRGASSSAAAAASAPSTSAGGRRSTVARGVKNRFVGGLDFSDLPTDVAEKLEGIMKENKGPARPKPRVNVVREMQRINKIKKHSRKKKK